jgi:4-hydroxybenzoate polyprenyltransferase
MAKSRNRTEQDQAIDIDNARVADAPTDNWVYRVLPRALWPHAQLARWDRPIGWQLLMWPCFWSAALAANVASQSGGWSPAVTIWHLVLFMAGAIAMRGAGCTWNDLVDHKIDAKVARTRSRPLPSGRISKRAAAVFLVAQALFGLLVLIQFNLFSIALGIASLGVVAIYPFAKRFTDWPQFFLGLAFSWGALMGWAGLFGELSMAPLMLYAGAIAWTIGYDTIYAHQDKEDDALVGVRSTARLFGENTKAWLVLFYGLFTVSYAGGLLAERRCLASLCRSGARGRSARLADPRARHRRRRPVPGAVQAQQPCRTDRVPGPDCSLAAVKRT